MADDHRGHDPEAYMDDPITCPFCGEAYERSGWARHLGACDGGDN